MKTGFTIDDVRDTLTADVTRFLGRIEATAREILDRKDLGSLPDAVPLFQAIGDHGHAIYGTSRLVSAESLSSSAHTLEELALRGRDELARATRHLDQAKRIAAALAAGASDMLAMLSLELEHRPSEADTVANSWRMRVQAMVTALTSQAVSRAQLAPTAAPPPADVPPVVAVPAPDVAAYDPSWSQGEPGPASAGPAIAPDDDDGFSFATSVADLPVDVETGAIDAELAEIFAHEARVTLASLAQQLAEFASRPGDRTLCRDLERSYHTLKGAAATVGLALVSDRAADLQHRVEALFDSAAPASDAFVADLIRDTEVLRRTAGLAPSSAASLASVASVASLASLASVAAIGDDVRAEFERESDALLSEAEHLVGGLIEAAPAAAPQLAQDLARSFHRLRGSALVAKVDAMAVEAERLEALCQADRVDTAALAAGLRRCRAVLSQPPATGTAGSAADDTRAVFLAEARALHGDATALLGRLGESPRVREQLRRLMHRLKGSALVVADDTVAHEATALHDLIAGESAASSSIGDGLTRLGELLGVGAVGERREAAPRQRVRVPPPDAELAASFQQECSELLDALDRGVLALEGSDRPKEHLEAVLRSYHTLKGVVHAMGLAPTGELVHRIEDFLETLQRAPILPPLRSVVSALLQAHAEIRRHLKTARHGYVEVTPGRLERQLGRLLAGRSRGTGSQALSHDGVPSSLQFGEGSEASHPSASSDGPDRKNIRVSIDRLDALMNLAGELVINRSRLLSRIEGLRTLQGDLGRHSKRLIDVVENFRDDHEFSSLARGPRLGAARTGQWGGFSELELDKYEDVNILARSLAESSTDMQEIFGQLGGGLASLVDDSDSLGAIIAGIQGEVTQARMVPLGSVFSRLQLPIRDAALREQREVSFVTEGEHVHLDKTIVDALFQPMLHLVRNAVSHGLEAPARRVTIGKPTTGTIAIRARQELGQIVIEVADDGAGLDLPKLHARGVAMGLIPADLPLDDVKVKELVFATGLSTQTAASAVAGRGVGCDVVRRAVERLNGSIRVETSAGKGTAFIVTLPLTLAITRALLVRHGGHTFAVPLYFTERIIDVQDHQVVESAGHRRIAIDDSFVPVRRMAEFFAGGEPTEDSGPILLLRVGDQQLTVQVDSVVGQEEIVVKELGALLTGHPMFAGVTIRGTGDIVLILDVPSLVERAGKPAEQRRAPALRPALPRPAEAVVAERLPPATPDAVTTAGPLRVLFVDDSVSVRKVAERTLQALGVSVTLAVDGLDALEKLHAAPFDLVFTDLEMPRMHGYELIRELRFLPAYAALPVIVVTSRSGKKHREEANALGATDYLTKPFSPQSLESALVKFGRPARGGSS